MTHPTRLSEERLREIEERAEKATPGEWYVAHASALDNWQFIRSRDGNTNHAIAEAWGETGPRPLDAEFIAHARTDIPELIAEIRTLQEELKWRRGVHGVTGEVDKLKAELVLLKRERDFHKEQFRGKALRNGQNCIERDQLRERVGRLSECLQSIVTEYDQPPYNEFDWIAWRQRAEFALAADDLARERDGKE